ncbi:response regulator [bacterium]|nr:response regulator [bacterium]
MESDSLVKGAFKILVVDDEETIRDVLVDFLDSEGYTVKTADSGVTALPIVDDFEPHVVLLDIRMPDMDGLQCLRSIKDMNTRIQVVMMSGFATEHIAQKSLEIGAFDYINKPLCFNHLKNVLQFIKITKFVEYL